MLSTLTGGQAALYILGGFLASILVFVVYCMFIGWGVPIARKERGFKD